MREIYIDELRPGDVVNKTLLSKNGMVMLEEGTVLTDYYIDRLRTLGFKRVSVRETGDRLAKENLSTAGRSRKAVEDTPPEDIAQVIAEMKNNEDALNKTGVNIRRFVESDLTFSRMSLPFLETARFRRDYRERVLSVLSEKALADELSVIMQSDPQLFQHSLQVSLLSNVLGEVKGYDKTRLDELTIGSLLFDVGMTRLPPELIKAKRKLTEPELEKVREHTRLGYKVLSEIKGVPQQAARAALLHHEKFSGHGYPLSFKGKDIPELAQLIGLADIYDALLSKRHHRDPYPSNEAMEYLFAASNHDFGANIVQMFLKHIVIFPVSSVVELNNGQIGIVEQTGDRLAHRPVLRMIREANGDPIAQPYTVDLNQNHHLAILRLVHGI